MPRWLALVLIAMGCLLVIVRIRNVIGCGVKSATELETPTMSDDGESLPMEDNSSEIEARSVSLQQSADELHSALQKHITNMYGAEVVTDWLVGCEVVTEDNERGLRLALSSDMTGWKVLGMSHTIHKYILVSNA